MLKGSWCEKMLAPKAKFDRRSFRWVAKGRNRLLVGCPKGKWVASTSRCKVGTRAHALLTPAKGRCARGRRRIKKG